jgi:hypothetical protein
MRRSKTAIGRASQTSTVLGTKCHVWRSQSKAASGGFKFRFFLRDCLVTCGVELAQ